MIVPDRSSPPSPPLDEATRAATQAAGAVTEARVQVVEACATAGLEPSDSPAGLIAAVAEARSAAVNERNALDAAVAARARCEDLSTQLTDATATRTGITERLAELDLEQERRSARLDE